MKKMKSFTLTVKNVKFDMYEIYGITHNGAVRDHNEDCFLINGYVVNSGECHITLPELPILVAVADGVGGCNAGEIASHLALTNLSQLRLPIGDQSMVEYVQQINEEILEYGIQNPSAKGLATTLTMLIVIEDQITAVNIGDSRIYRHRDGFLKQITKDHSLVQTLFEAGEIGREEMFTHPQKNIVLQSLGGNQENQNLEVDVQHLRGHFENEDVFIVCSDGLSDLVNDNDIENVLQQSSSLTQSVSRLVQQANNNGGTDNITVVGVKHL